MSYLGYTLCWFVIAATAMNIVNRREWWFRIFDFPRAQLALLGITGVFLLVYFAYSNSQISVYLLIVASLTFAATIFHAHLVLPYTPFWHRTVDRVRQQKPEQQFTLLLSNVLQTNQAFNKLIDLVNQHQPDVLITMESDEHWENALTEIEQDYPEHLKCAQDNFYGMHLFSKYPLNHAEECTLIQSSIPSFHTEIELSENHAIRLHCIHPRPPSPTEAETSTQRDQEMTELAKRVDHKKPSIVAGDFNDVPWSTSMIDFLQRSKLQDPRKGRLMVNTFHAGYPFMRWPLDHVFHSDHFDLVRYKRLPSIGSDHFPILVTLQLKS